MTPIDLIKKLAELGDTHCLDYLRTLPILPKPIDPVYYDLEWDALFGEYDDEDET